MSLAAFFGHLRFRSVVVGVLSAPREHRTLRLPFSTSTGPFFPCLAECPCAYRRRLSNPRDGSSWEQRPIHLQVDGNIHVRLHRAASFPISPHNNTTKKKKSLAGYIHRQCLKKSSGRQEEPRDKCPVVRSHKRPCQA